MRSCRLLELYFLQEQMDKAQMRQLLGKSDQTKMNSFLWRAAKKKEYHSDLLNLLQIWLHCLLYHKHIYPPQSFQERQVFGAPVYTASSPPLKQYLDDFFSKIQNELSNINHLQVLVLTNDHQLIQTNTLLFQDLFLKFQGQKYQAANVFQKQLFFREFIGNFTEQMKKGFVSSSQVKFKLRIGYRLQSQEKSVKEMMEGWMPTQKILRTGRIGSSLRTSHLNMIYQIA